MATQDRRNRIRFLAAERGMTIAELAQIAGIQPPNLRRYSRQEAQPRLEIAEKIATALGVSVDEVLGTELGQQRAAPTPGVRTISVYGAAQGGLGFDITDVSAPVDTIPAPDYLSGSATCYAVLVVGDSMEPRFSAGETLYVHPGLPVRRGDDVVIQLRAGPETHAVVKRFVRSSESQIVVEQLNPERELRFDAKTVAAVHKVVGVRF